VKVGMWVNVNIFLENDGSNRVPDIEKSNVKIKE